MRKKASIIMILDNQGMMTKNCLYMLAEYKNINDYELVFAYSHAEEKYFSGLIQECMGENTVIHYKIESSDNRSVVYNRASHMAHTDIFIFMDTNIVLMENCLEEMVESLYKGDILAVQPMLIQCHTSLIYSTGYLISENCAWHAFQNREVHARIVNQSYVRSALTSSLLAINRLAFEELNGFDKRISHDWMGGEITLRISERGYQNYYNHKAKAYYIQHEDRGSEVQGMTQVYGLKECNMQKGYQEIKDLIQKQIKKGEWEKKYVIINFSGIGHIKDIMKDLHIKAIKTMNYSTFSGAQDIRLEKIVPLHLAEQSCEYIYFTNNFYQIKNNPIWFQKRLEYDDLILDLSGNVLRIPEMISNKM